MSIAFLFPGQGSQRPGMLHRLPDTAASATVLAEAEFALRSTASRAAGRLDGGIAELDTAETLEKSQVAVHVALLVAGVAGARALMEDEGVRPSLVAGHGTGGYAAAVICEVLTLEEAVRAVRLRGDLLERGEEPEGDLAIRLAQHLATVKRRPQPLAYLSGVYGRTFRNEVNAVFDDLAQSVARPVRWEEMATVMSAEGITCCVELPPGRALSERMGETTAGGAQGVRVATGAPGVRTVSVEEYGITAVAEVARSGPGAAEPGGLTGPGDPSGQSSFA